MIKKTKLWRLIAVLTLGLMTISILSGCAPADKAEKVEKINITYVKSPLNVPSIIQKSQNMLASEFGKDNIEVAFHEITAGPKQTQALAAGSLDILNALGATSAILAAANGVDLKIISIFSRAPEAFMIISKTPDIDEPADLKGKKVGGPTGTVLHQLLMAALTANSLTAQDIEFVSMDIPSAVAAMQNGSIDAALAAGPASLRALNAGAHIVTTGEGLVEGAIVVAVRGEFLRKHPDLVKRFNKVHQESLAFIKNNPEETYRLTAEETGLSVEDVKKMFPWYDFNHEIKPSDIEEMKKTQEFLIKNGMLTNSIKIEDLIVTLK